MVKERETPPVLIDKMADKTCDSSSPVWNRQKLGFLHKNGSLGFTVQSAVCICSVEASAVYSTLALLLPHENNLLCRKQLIVPRLVKNMQDVA